MLRFLLVNVLRESRGSRARGLFFVLCVAVGVSAVVSVAALREVIERSLRSRSRELLGGDLAIESRRPIGDVTAALPAEQRAVPRVELAILPSMVRGERESRLAEIKAVRNRHGSYPLAGKLVLDPPLPLEQLLDDRSVVVAPELLSELQLARGDTLHVGGQPFRIVGEVRAEPDNVNVSFALGPRVFMTRAALERTTLLGFGSRTRHRTVLSLPAASPAELDELKRTLVESLPRGGTHVTVETHREAQPALRSALGRTERYLGLVALLSLFIAGVGVAQIVSAWLQQAIPRTAILRCLGLRPREVVAIYVGQVLLLALLGSVVGALAGALTPALVAAFEPALLSPELPRAIPWLAIARGLALGLLVPLLFSAAPLLAVYRVAPVRVLRSDAQSLPVPVSLRWGVPLLSAGGLFATALWQTGELVPALSFTAGVGVLFGVLWLATRGLLALVRRLPRGRMPVVLWQGAAALARPGAGTAGSIVALGLGTLVLLSLTLLERTLTRELDTALPPDAPTMFLLDVQPDQWPGVAALAQQHGAAASDSVPVAMARLLAIDGRAVEQLLKDRALDPNERMRSQWVLTREQRVTWMRELPRDNRVLEGSLWSDPNVLEVSLEVEFARDLGAKLGSVLRFDVQGVPLDLTITSIRSVEWRSFSSNFFLVAEPGALDDAPHYRFGAIRMAGDRQTAFQNALAAEYPNVTTLRVQALLASAGEVLARAALGVRLLGAFALLAGFSILIAAITASELRRAREAAILKVLGVERARIVAMFATEYALRGALAALLGTGAAYVLAAIVTRYYFNFAALPPWFPCVVAFVAIIALSVFSGLLASARALSVSPKRVYSLPG